MDRLGLGERLFPTCRFCLLVVSSHGREREDVLSLPLYINTRSPPLITLSKPNPLPKPSSSYYHIRG